MSGKWPACSSQKITREQQKKNSQFPLRDGSSCPCRPPKHCQIDRSRSRRRHAPCSCPLTSWKLSKPSSRFERQTCVGIRYKVAVGTANGLEYLHERCHKRIIHRDIKAANILLTEDFEPQICDFGLAKWLPDEVTHHTLPSFEGTFGYLAPEYCMHGVVDEKTDVFAFGILLLELISGRRAVNSSQQSLLMWAKPLLEQNRIRDLVDPSLGDSYDSKQMDRAAKTAYICIQHSSVLRPRMSEVLKLLSGGDEGRAENGRALHRSFLRRTYSEEIFDAEEYNATRYLSDITRHKQIAFDF
ncbi:unnamed protein product [Musa acuminata var. zebrina]